MTDTTTITEKAKNSTVAQLQAMAKKKTFLVAYVPLLDKSGENNVPVEILRDIAQRVAVKAPDLYLMLIAGGSTYCSIVARVPDRARLPARDWMVEAGFAEYGDHTAEYTIQIATTLIGSACPFKDKDALRTRAFDVLKANDIYEDDASSEELPGYDINAD